MRILLVEDERSLSKALMTLLEKNNYSVDTVFDGEEATNYIQHGSYDAIILDLMLPKKDGISVLRDMRSEGITTPVLILSAKSEVDDKVLGLDSGANDYLTKPFSIKELLARIRSITRSTESRTDSKTAFGDLTLDLATYELSTSGGSVKLANKEFQMMELLMRNPGHLISTERFMEKIWGYDAEAEINVVWVYISYLRRKLSSLECSQFVSSNISLAVDVSEEINIL